MEKKMKRPDLPDQHGSPEYELAKRLLTEKKALQTRLREVDRLLRQLELPADGVIQLARKSLEKDSVESVSRNLPIPS